MMLPQPGAQRPEELRAPHDAVAHDVRDRPRAELRGRRPRARPSAQHTPIRAQTPPPESRFNDTLEMLRAEVISEKYFFNQIHSELARLAAGTTTDTVHVPIDDFRRF